MLASIATAATFFLAALDTSRAASTDRITSKYTVCYQLLKEVNPPEDALHIDTMPANNNGLPSEVELSYVIQYGLYSPRRRNAKLDLVPTTGCDGDAVQHGDYKLLKGGLLTDVPTTQFYPNDRVSYIDKEPVYAEFTYKWTDDIDLLVHGWIDPAANYKICAWALRATDQAGIDAWIDKIHC